MKCNDASGLDKTDQYLEPILENKPKFNRPSNLEFNQNFYDSNKDVTEVTPKGRKKYQHEQQPIANISTPENNQKIPEENQNTKKYDQNISSCQHNPSESKNSIGGVNMSVIQEDNT